MQQKQPQHGAMQPFLYLIASYRDISNTSSTPNRVLFIPFRQLPATFTGTGDLLAALLLSHLTDAISFSEKKSGRGIHIDNQGLETACVRALGSMQAVLNKTVERTMVSSLEATLSEIGNMAGSDGTHSTTLDEGKSKIVKCKELSIIQSKEWIENPPLSLEFESFWV